MSSGIYCIENVENGHIYVGQAWNIEKRMNANHKECNAIYLALIKYGKESFIRYPIEYCEIEELDYWEEYYIKEFCSHSSKGGYNLTWGGNAPMRGRNHTEAWKIEKSNGMTGEKNHFYGKSHSDKSKKQISDSKTNLSEKTRKLMSEARTGLKDSDETREKKRIARLGNKNPMFGKKRPWAISNYFGVTFHRPKENWEAGLIVDGKRKYIGIYNTELEAAIAYDNFVIENNLPNPLNFPETLK